MTRALLPPHGHGEGPRSILLDSSLAPFYFFVSCASRIGYGEVRVKAAPLVAALCVVMLCACGEPDHVVRARVEDAAATGRQAAQAVGSYMRKHGRAPAQIEEAYIRPAELKDIKLMSVNGRTGTVRIALAFPPVEGKSLLFLPTRNPNKTIVWRCTSEDIEAKYLPEGCR